MFPKGVASPYIPQQCETPPPPQGIHCNFVPILLSKKSFFCSSHKIHIAIAIPMRVLCDLVELVSMVKFSKIL